MRRSSAITGVEAAALEGDLVGLDAAAGSGWRGQRGRAWPRPASARRASEAVSEVRPRQALAVGGFRTVRPQPVREAWSTGADVAGAPWQTRRPPPRRNSTSDPSRPRTISGPFGVGIFGDNKGHMLDTHAIAGSLTDGEFTPAQADCLRRKVIRRTCVNSESCRSGGCCRRRASRGAVCSTLTPSLRFADRRRRKGEAA